MKFCSLLTALLIAVCGSPSLAHEPTVLVDESFAGGQFNWDRSGANYFIYHYRPVVLDGEVHICGAYAGVGSRGGVSNRFHQAAMREARITVNGDTTLRSLRFFRQVNRRHIEENLVGTEAQCRGLGIMADSLNGLSFDIVFREGSYRL